MQSRPETVARLKRLLLPLVGTVWTLVAVPALCLLYAGICYCRLEYDRASARAECEVYEERSAQSIPAATLRKGQVVGLKPPCHTAGREWVSVVVFEVERRRSVDRAGRADEADDSEAPPVEVGILMGERHEGGQRLWKVETGLAASDWVDSQQFRVLQDSRRGFARVADVQPYRSKPFRTYVWPRTEENELGRVCSTIWGAGLRSLKLVIPAVILSVLVSLLLAAIRLDRGTEVPAQVAAGTSILARRFLQALSAFPVFVLGYAGMLATHYTPIGSYRTWGPIVVMAIGNLVLADMVQHFTAELTRLRGQRFVKELAALKGVLPIKHYWRPLLVAVVLVVKPRVPLFMGLSLIVEKVFSHKQGIGYLVYERLAGTEKSFPHFFGAVAFFLLIVVIADLVHWLAKDVWLHRSTGRRLLESGSEGP